MDSSTTHTVAVFLFPGPSPATASAVSFLRQAGFDLLSVGEVSGRRLIRARPAHGACFDGEVRTYSYAVTLDLFPWQAVGTSDVPVPIHDNARLRLGGYRYGHLEKGLVHGACTEPRHKNEWWVSPDSEAAWRLVGELWPDQLADLRREANCRARAFQPPFPVLKSLTQRGNNARTDLVRWRGQTAICKTFRPGRDTAFQNELTGLRLGHQFREIPGILEEGDRWLVTSCLQGKTARQVAADRGGLLPMAKARRIARFIERLHAAGYAHLDFHPDHVFFETGEGLKIIDFDRFYRYEDPPDSVLDCFEINGVPNGFAVNKPMGPPVTYASRWFPIIGIPATSLFREAPWLQRLRQEKFRFYCMRKRREDRRQRVRNSRAPRSPTNFAGRPVGAMPSAPPKS